MGKKGIGIDPPPDSALHAIDFENSKATFQIGLVMGDELEDETRLALVHANITAKDLRRELHGYLKEIVQERLRQMDATTFAELHIEEMVREKVAEALQDGWTMPGKSTRTISNTVERMIGAEATRRIASDYAVDVAVTLRRKS